MSTARDLFYQPTACVERQVVQYSEVHVVAVAELLEPYILERPTVTTGKMHVVETKETHSDFRRQALKFLIQFNRALYESRTFVFDFLLHGATTMECNTDMFDRSLPGERIAIQHYGWQSSNIWTLESDGDRLALINVLVSRKDEVSGSSVILADVYHRL